ncbi:hypothetical protein FBUS_01988 [Fasciolopsis buskii]|uniref:Uncharacterized protein n=1 Tax=Fasciolopsis buskii TaxID=27845 RepID=A0A8E0RSD6_9TREM|nr:hypothetical protein FBUS_01988 [Fasciolopsis buski]
MPNSPKHRDNSEHKRGYRFIDRFRSVTRFLSNPTLNRQKANKPKHDSLTRSTAISTTHASSTNVEANMKSDTRSEILNKHEKSKKLSLSTIKQKNKRNRLSTLDERQGKAATIDNIHPTSVASSSYWSVSNSVAEIQITELDDLPRYENKQVTNSCLPLGDLLQRSFAISTKEDADGKQTTTNLLNSHLGTETSRSKLKISAFDPVEFCAYYDSFTENPAVGNSISDNYSIFGSSIDLDKATEQTLQTDMVNRNAKSVLSTSYWNIIDKFKRAKNHRFSKSRSVTLESILSVDGFQGRGRRSNTLPVLETIEHVKRRPRGLRLTNGRILGKYSWLKSGIFL